MNPDLVVRDGQDKPYTVRYEAVNAMLLNEFLKEYHKAQVEERKVAELEASVMRQQRQIETLAAGLQKVNQELAQAKSATRLVVSEQ